MSKQRWPVKKRLEDLTEPELSVFMRTLAQEIEGVMRTCGVDKPLFALVVFNDPKVGQYISNCERDCMIAALRETAERLERNEAVERK